MHRFPLIAVLLLGLSGAHFADCARASEPDIVGSEKFVKQIREALLLLKTRDSKAHASVTTYIGKIQQGQRSGMWAYMTPPTYEMSDASAFYSISWAAATIAHDSCHSRLYHEYRKAHGGPVPRTVWTGTAAERQCMEHQLAVMRRIGASEWELDHALMHMHGDYTPDHETWDEYKKRRW